MKERNSESFHIHELLHLELENLGKVFNRAEGNDRILKFCVLQSGVCLILLKVYSNERC